MSNEELKLKLSVIISATNTSGNQKLDAIMELFNQLHPSPTPDVTPVEDGKQGGEVGMSVEDVLADIISIRNKLYEDLPTGEMNAFELLQTIKWHINELDNYCTTLSTYKSQPSTPVQDGWVSVEDGLPKEGRDVLVTDGFACMVMIYRKKEFNNYGKIDWWYNEDVTHWQPLPSPPVNKQD